MENTQEAPNKQLHAQDPLQEIEHIINVMENVGETPSSTGRTVEDADAILSASATWSARGLDLFFRDISHIFKKDDLGMEVARIAIPAALALAAEPLVTLVDNAFIGRLGSVELAAVGVSIDTLNRVLKIALYPLVSVTTSFVAEEDALCSAILEEKGAIDLEKNSTMTKEMNKLAPSVSDATKPINACSKSSTTVKKRKCIPSASTTLIVGAVLGVLQTILLITMAKYVLHIMGVKSVRG